MSVLVKASVVDGELKMKIEKKRVLSFGSPYSICCGHIGKQQVLIVGSESIGGDFTCFIGNDYRPTKIVEGLGGIMSIVIHDSWHMPSIYTAEGLHPNFISKNAGLSLYVPENGLQNPWKRHRIVDIPFIHRIALVSVHGVNTIVAASLCNNKDNMDDWSSPGAVYAIPITDEHQVTEIESCRIFDGLKQNHGMFVRRKPPEATVYISGDDGIYTIHKPVATEDWVIDKILNQPVSELALYDLDGDGEDEILTVEPFHGDRVSIYKKSESSWTRVFETDVELGHGIWAGHLAGEDSFIVGSRAGKRDLCMYTVVDSQAWRMHKSVIDEGTGTAQLDVLSSADRDIIVATNNYIDEVAIYEMFP